MFAFGLVASLSLLCLQCVPSILFLENYVKQMAMFNDECILLDVLEGAIMTEERK